MHFIITNTREGISLVELQELHLMNPMVIQQIDTSQYLFDIDNDDIKILSSNIPLSEQITDDSGFAEHNVELYYGKTWLATITPQPSIHAPKTIYFNVNAKSCLEEYCIKKKFEQESENLSCNYRSSSDSLPSAKRLKQEVNIPNTQAYMNFFLRDLEKKKASNATSHQTTNVAVIK